MQAGRQAYTVGTLVEQPSTTSVHSIKTHHLLRREGLAELYEARQQQARPRLLPDVGALAQHSIPWEHGQEHLGEQAAGSIAASSTIHRNNARQQWSSKMTEADKQ